MCAIITECQCARKILVVARRGGSAAGADRVVSAGARHNSAGVLLGFAASFMEKKIVLVTGGAGHVGSHVIELLLENPDYQVISLDNYWNGMEANHIPRADYRLVHTKDVDKL